MMDEIQIERTIRGYFLINNLKLTELPDFDNWVMMM